jgi:hypothetical protein
MLLQGDVPTGDHLARVFPWWSLGQANIPNASPNGFPFVVRGFGAQRANEPRFLNDKPWPISVTEIRIWSDDLLGTNFLENVVWEVETDFQGHIFSKWMPTPVLNTHDDRFTMGEMHTGTFKLPAPFYIQPGYLFRMIFDPDFANAAAFQRTFDVSLHGRDPNTGASISSGQTVTLPAAGGAVIPIEVNFDENRDSTVRAMWLEEIRFGAVAMVGTQALPNPFQNMLVSMRPPNGPMWTKDRYTPVFSLFEQVSVQNAFGVGVGINPVTIHRPEAPYPLRPGDKMTIQGMYEGAAAIGRAAVVFALVRGYQLGDRGDA